MSRTVERATERSGAAEPTDALAIRWLEREASGRTRGEATLDRLRAESRSERDLRGIRLPGADLRGLDLAGADLSGADLTGANLAGARLLGAKLCRAVLAGARLEKCELLGADLTGADLTECRASGAGLGNARLDRATCFNADFENATLSRASLRQCELKAARLKGARIRESDLSDADLSRAELRQADLERSRVDRARFFDADLREARLRGLVGYDRARWVGADILGVDFCGAYLIRRTIMDQSFLHEFRNQSRLNAVIYWAWWLTSDCGRSFVRWGSWIGVLAFAFAGLFSLVAVDYGEHATFLSSLYYSVVTLTTLGYGDAVPASPAAQVLAMIEVVVGYVMLGGLLSIFANKMARRAE